MKKVNNINELIELSYNKYKSKNAITIKREYEKNINYFNFKFDIYSLARAIKSKQNTINKQKIIILSENRYEFIVTYLASIIAKNTVIIIDNSISKQAIEKIIKKQQINTIFFSNKTKNKITEIYKLNENNKSNKKRIINLINFDSNNKFPIIEYEKLINIGRYIENYSIDNNVQEEPENQKESTIIINSEETIKYQEKDLLKNAYTIGENIKFKKKKKIDYINELNTPYKIIFNIYLPLIYGNNIIFDHYDYKNQKTENIQIIQENTSEALITYKNSTYKITTKEKQTSITKIEKPKTKWHFNKNKNTTNFILIKAPKEEKTKEQEEIITM